MTTRTCYVCGEDKPLSEYNSMAGGTGSRPCKPCHTARTNAKRRYCDIELPDGSVERYILWTNRSPLLHRGGRVIYDRWLRKPKDGWPTRAQLVSGARVSGARAEPKEYTPGAAPRVVQSPTTRIIRPGQAAFRKAILARDGRCVITGTPADAQVRSKGTYRSIVQAAHIKPVKLCEDGEYWDLDNGLAMRADVHAGFDTGLFTIGDEGEIIPSRWMQGFYPEHILGDLTEGQRAYLRLHRDWTISNWSRWAFY